MKTYSVPATLTNTDANNFQPPHGDQAERYAHNRRVCLDVAQEIRATSPPSREQSLAITKLEEVCFWWNAAIARNERNDAA